MIWLYLAGYNIVCCVIWTISYSRQPSTFKIHPSGCTKITTFLVVKIVQKDSNEICLSLTFYIKDVHVYFMTYMKIENVL